MSFKTYNNNDNQQLVNITYSAYGFSNPDFMDGSKLCISYFNKLLKVGIAKKTGKPNDAYPTYDVENQKAVFLSFSKAKILYDLIEVMKKDENIHNVCVETNKGLLTVSDGKEYGSDVPCIAVTTTEKDGSIVTIVYQTKTNYIGACNYDSSNGSYDNKEFTDLELDAFQNVLINYYNAATYAIAATVMESGMYKRDALYKRIYAIAEKVGAINTNGNGGNYSNKSSFLNGGGNNQSQASSKDSINNISKEYESASYDDIVRNMA